MDFNTMLDNLFDEKTVDKLAKKTNLQPDKVNPAAQMVLPVLLQKLGANSVKPDSALSLEKAINDHKNDDLSDLQGFLSNVDTNEGDKMLRHILGEDKELLANNVAQKSGIDSSSMMKMMTYLAPLVMAYLGNQKKQTESEIQTNPTGVSDLLGQVTKQYIGSSKVDSSILESVADLFSDSSSTDKKADLGFLGDLLGGFFKK